MLLHTWLNELKIVSFRWEQLGHAPYSPDIVLSNYHILPFKKYLGSHRHNYDHAVKMTVLYQAADFYEEGIKKLIVRCDKLCSSID